MVATEGSKKLLPEEFLDLAQFSPSGRDRFALFLKAKKSAMLVLDEGANV
jgi:hypothetical protein